MSTSTQIWILVAALIVMYVLYVIWDMGRVLTKQDRVDGGDAPVSVQVVRVPGNSPVFPPEMSPVHAGLYKTIPVLESGAELQVEMAVWDGEVWRHPHARADFECYPQTRKWWGLSEQVPT